MSQETKDEPDTKAEGEAEGGFGSAFAERANRDAKPHEQPEQVADEATDSEPAPQAGSEAAPPDKAAGASEAEPRPPAFDPFAGLTPEQKAHFERLQASERSQRGRVGALTKKLNGFERAPPAPAPAPAEQKPEAAAEGDAGKKAADLDARLNSTAEEYGDVVGPLVEVIKELRSEIATMKPKVDAVDLDKDANEIAAAYAQLGSKHPDWEQIASDDGFKSWTASQPANVQALLGSSDPDEVSLGLSLYKAEGRVAAAADAGNEGKPGSTATGDRRQRQLEGSRDVKARGAPAAAGIPNEFGAAFHARAQRPPT